MQLSVRISSGCLRQFRQAQFLCRRGGSIDFAAILVTIGIMANNLLIGVEKYRNFGILPYCTESQSLGRSIEQSMCRIFH